MERHTSVLVTGAGGQVGRALQAILPSASYRAHEDLDVGRATDVARAVTGHEVVVHCAAVTNVDRCEREPELAARVNDEGTWNVVEAARKTGAWVLYLSTDYVFDGSKVGEYEETDRPFPINHYGRTKLAGEQHVLAVGGHLVVRSSWVYGAGRNFVKAIVDAARHGRALTVTGDQVGRPTSADDLATAMVRLVELRPEGVLHVAGDGEPPSRSVWAAAALREAGMSAHVNDVDTDSYMRANPDVVAQRPRNSVLRIEKARTLGVHLPPWESSLRSYLRRHP